MAGDVSHAAALITESLKESPGNQEYLDFAVEVGAELSPLRFTPAVRRA